MRTYLSILVVCLVLPGAALGDYLSEEVSRQAGFAEQELAQGRYDRALTSAESALRLDPEFDRALILKALAYEGLGNEPLALSLLDAWAEANPGVARPPEAEALRARLSSTGVETLWIESSDPTSESLGTLPAEPFRERSQAALRAGRCESALAAASEYRIAAPDAAEGWRLLGDAERCHDHKRNAVLAYENYLDTVEVDETVERLVDGLRQSLAELTVHVLLPSDEVTPKVQVLLPDGKRAEPRERDVRTVRFSDLPSGAELSLLVTGRGLASSTTPLASMAPGAIESVTVSPEVIGLGAVRIGPYDPDELTVLLSNEHEELPVVPGQVTQVTAGRGTAVITSTRGTVELPFVVAAGAETSIEPSKHLPSELTVIGLPSHSRVRVVVGAAGPSPVERVLLVPRELGTIDDRSGLRIAPPQEIRGLPGGPATLEIVHPTLGSMSAATVLGNGESNATTIDASAMPGSPRIAEAYLDWRTSSTTRAGRRSRAAAGIGIASGLGLAGGGVLLALSGNAWEQRVATRTAVEATVGRPGAEEVESHHARARLRHERLLATGSALSGISSIGIAIAIPLGVSGGTKGGNTSWEPWDDTTSP